MAESPLYDLLLMLNTDAPEEQRTRVLSLVESAISQAGGEIERNDNWGRRPMAFQIRHQPEAEYHLLQFRAPGSLPEELAHTLRITDGVLRVRIIKVRRGTPDAKSTPPPIVAVATGSSSSAGASDGAGSRDRGGESLRPDQAEAVDTGAAAAVEHEAEDSAGPTADQEPSGPEAGSPNGSSE